MREFLKVHETMLIDGARIDRPDRLEVTNPARPSEIVGTIARGTPEDIDAAVLSAKAAQPGWARQGFRERAAILERGLAKLEEGLEERAVLLVRENGKPLQQARDELMSVIRRQRLALSYASQLDEGRQLKAPRGRSFISYKPFGVVASIVPWNSPIILGFTQIVAALLVGNSVIVKPPESCPLTLIQSIVAFSSVLPNGVLNIVTGLPGEIGDALTSHPGIDKVAFTGSIGSARHILSRTAQTIKDVTLELGGNDPAIILPGTTLSDEMVDSIRDAAFEMTGQVCMAIKRIYVPASLRDAFLAGFSQSVDRIVVGDGLADRVTMGPLHSASGQTRAHALLESAAKSKATVRSLGSVHNEEDFAQGHFVMPTVVTDIEDSSPLVSDEQFCPVIPVLAYDDLDEAVARANDTVFGLSGSVWGDDVDQAIRVAGRLEAGQIWVNAHGPAALNHQAPYGGVKQSGIGRKSGFEGILEYAQSQTITTREV
jgi:acyl-CoA reductase-like NAD-dependent aldehyde dehydrogenase